MKILWQEFKRNFINRWFYITILLTVAALWLGLGTESYWLLHGAEMDLGWLLDTTFTSSSHALSLPILASLPGAAAVWKEINSGTVRNILFRIGMRWYILTRVMNLLVITVLAQCVGSFFFLLLIGLCTGGWVIPFHYISARLLSTVFFALLGSLGALLTKDTTCSYAVPVAIGFALSMLCSRFLPEAEWLDPVCWLYGDPSMMGMLLLVLFIITLIYMMILKQEVKQHV